MRHLGLRNVISKLPAKINTAREFATSALVLTVFFGLLFTLGRQFFRDSVVLEPISVPLHLEESGLNGGVAAQWLIDSIRTIQRNAASTKETKAIQATPKQINIEMPGVGFSLATIEQIIREALDLPSPFIKGEIIKLGDSYHIRLRLPGAPYIHIEQPLGDKDVEKLIAKSAEKILLLKDPYIVAVDHYRKAEYKKAIEVIYNMRTGADRLQSAYNELLLAAIATKQLEHEKASLHLKKADQLAPNLGVVKLNQAIQHALKKDPSTALSKYKEAKQLNPELQDDAFHSQILTELGRELVTDDSAEEKLALFRKAIDLAPENASAIIRLAEVLAHRQRPEEKNEMLKLYEAAIGLVPNKPKYHFQYGKTLWEMGNKDKGCVQVKKAVELKPAMRDLANKYQCAK